MSMPGLDVFKRRSIGYVPSGQQHGGHLGAHLDNGTYAEDAHGKKE